MSPAVRVIGAASVLAFLGWVVWRGIDELPPVDLSSVRSWAWLGMALALYVTSQIGGSVAWRRLLEGVGVDQPERVAESQLLVSQIAKYLPGNVGHLVGRFALARRDGVPAGAAGMAMAAETACLLTAAGFLVTLTALTRPDLLAELASGTGMESNRLRVLAVLAGIAVVGAGTFVYLRSRRSGGRSARRVGASLVWAVTLYLANFGLLGVSLHAVSTVVSPGFGPGPIFATAVFTVAWTAGFLIPGAPGGIGMRDGLIVLGLSLVTGSGAALAAALMHRGVSVLGDVVTFGLGWRLRGGLPARGVS